jgi:hypothetical protein
MGRQSLLSGSKFAHGRWVTESWKMSRLAFHRSAGSSCSVKAFSEAWIDNGRSALILNGDPIPGDRIATRGGAVVIRVNSVAGFEVSLAHS